MSACFVPGCESPVRCKGLCAKHYTRNYRHGDVTKGDPITTCRHEGCNRPHAAKGFCQKHYGRYRKYGSAAAEALQRARPGHGRDYRKVRVPGGNMAEHRFVMSQYLGRPLLPEESIHHINGDRRDNRIENLELWSKSHPFGQRVVDKVEWAREILARYGDYTDPS